MGIKSIPVSEAKEGMVLAQTVKNNKGIVLSAAGTELSMRLIATLEKMGVEVITIESEEEMTDEEFEKQKNAIERRFSKIKPNTTLDMLKTVVLQRLESER